MPTIKTVLFAPPLRNSDIAPAIEKWLLSIQNAHPLHSIDTSNGSYSEAAPAAGLDSTTGQSNQNQQITYIKTSNDANTFTLTGVQGGPYTLQSQYDTLKIKSDGTFWWAV